MNQAEFENLFQEEHREILTNIENLTEQLRNEETSELKEMLDKLNKLLGPHFRYEEEALYPSLKDRYGRIYVKRLYDSHEGTIHTVRKLMRMTEESTLNKREALDLIYGWLLPHVSDCEGLSIMVNQIPDDTIDEIEKARERAQQEDLDLLTWADQVRTEPDFGTLSIYDS